MGIKGKRWSVDETFEENPVLGEMDGNIKMCDALSFCARQRLIRRLGKTRAEQQRVQPAREARRQG